MEKICTAGSIYNTSDRVGRVNRVERRKGCWQREHENSWVFSPWNRVAKSGCGETPRGT